MTEAEFVLSKEKLIALVLIRLNEKIDAGSRSDFQILLEVLNEYSFENRFQKKGLLTHTIIDSLDLNYPFGEKFIEFDREIS